jgi:CDP-diacylglycerol--glycerol-3-phosphate 3-phosphatidyltransferase
MTRFRQVPEPTIIVLATTTESPVRKRRTFTGAIGAACMLPLRAIINLCVAWRIHPNTLTLIGVLINVAAAWALGFGRFTLAFVIMLVANIFDFIDGKVAHILGLQSEFGAFWDSTLDRFSDLALLTGLIFLYSKLNRSDYVMIAALTLIFSIMTSYARARAESLVEKCKVGFMERPERIVLLMIGAITNRMAGVLWVLFVLDPGGHRPDFLHLPRAQQPADAVACRVEGHLQPRVLLDRRARDAALRHLGDRDPGIRVADTTRLARGSDGARSGAGGVDTGKN